MTTTDWEQAVCGTFEESARKTDREGVAGFMACFQKAPEDAQTVIVRLTSSKGYTTVEPKAVEDLQGDFKDVLGKRPAIPS